MARKRHTAEEIVAKLRQVDVLTSQGRGVAEAVRSIGVTGSAGSCVAAVSSMPDLRAMAGAREAGLRVRTIAEKPPYGLLRFGYGDLFLDHHAFSVEYFGGTPSGAVRLAASTAANRARRLSITVPRLANLECRPRLRERSCTTREAGKSANALGPWSV
jgi:hypothetical protein